MISSEYLTIEKKKLLTNGNWAVWVPDILKDDHPDSIRYLKTDLQNLNIGLMWGLYWMIMIKP
jgi:methionyl-tRNA synthetase